MLSQTLRRFLFLKDKLPVQPKDCNIANIDIIIISSITQTPSMTSEASSLITFSSSKTLITKTELVTEIASAKNKLSNNEKFKA